MPNKVNFVNIPQELKANASFCLWKLRNAPADLLKFPTTPRLVHWPGPTILPLSQTLARP